MRVLFVCLLLLLPSSFVSLTASAADEYEAMVKRLDREISGLPSHVREDFISYTSKLQANAKNISNKQISNCSSVADLTLEVLVLQGDNIGVSDLNRQFLKSRVWTSLYLFKVKAGENMPMDTLQSDLDAAKNSDVRVKLISGKNTECNALLIQNAGSIDFGASK